MYRNQLENNTQDTEQGTDPKVNSPGVEGWVKGLHGLVRRLRGCL